MKYPFRKVLTPAATTAALLFMLAAAPAQADWPNNSPTKYYLPPDLTPAGNNVLAAQPPAACGQPLVLADDFPRNRFGPITGIHIWALWTEDKNIANIIPDMPITPGFWSNGPGKFALHTQAER